MVFGDRVVVLARLHHQHVLDVLLGQRGTALRIALGNVGLHERAHHALHVHARMFEETTVLTGHDGLLHILGHVLDRHHDAVLRIERRNHRAVGRVHARLLRQARHVEINPLHLQGRNHGLRHGVGAEHGRHEQQARHNAAGDAQHDIGEHQREGTTDGHRFLLRHGAHSKEVPLPRPAPSTSVAISSQLAGMSGKWLKNSPPNPTCAAASGPGRIPHCPERAIPAPRSPARRRCAGHRTGSATGRPPAEPVTGANDESAYPAGR